jgi:low affinity Fe/Cu permease
MKQREGEYRFSKLARGTAKKAGRPWAFALAATFVALWIVTGPIFGFSDTWQLVMNTVSSIVTFLMVFLIQNAQNRDSAALQLKLDELIKTLSTRTEVIGIEEKSDPEIKKEARRIRGE